MKPKIIHTRTFSCADDHPIVWYTFDENNKAMCDYCAAQFVYEPKKTRTEEVLKILEENKITNVGENTPYGREEEEAMEISRKQSKKNKEERTPSEKMQDDLEPIPIPCPMHEDYDDLETNDDYVNKILKGSG